MSLLKAIHRARFGAPDVEAVLETALQPEASASILPPAAAAEHKETAMSDPIQTPAATATTATQPDQTATANARAEAAAAERTRIKAIVTHAEADGRGKLAAHLAFATDMSADAAGGLLAASPKEPASAPVRTDAETYEASRTGAEGLAQPAPKKDAETKRAGLSAAVDKEVKRLQR